jgi:hypothetical protein
MIRLRDTRLCKVGAPHEDQRRKVVGKAAYTYIGINHNDLSFCRLTYLHGRYSCQVEP